ncbi:MAG: deoxyribonuclease IV [Acidimicrobiia bacterium]|nr:deoxyribonuclease IV [Acidimicrobiia bacterium]
MEIGAHVPSADPLDEAATRNADIVQVFLGNPQQWRAPKEREDAEALMSSEVGIYVHAPYLINVVSPNNRVRIPSRKSLQQTCDAAASVGARGVIVHGGHLTDAEEPLEVGFERWRKALESLDTDVPVLIENTAGGDRAMARRFDVLAMLWDEIGDLSPGFCLDTCHAWAGGEPLDEVVERTVAITGAIDLIHFNDSRDAFDSHRDRHANLGDGEIPEDELVGVLTSTDAPIVVETPGGAEEQAADIAWLRDRL